MVNYDMADLVSRNDQPRNKTSPSAVLTDEGDSALYTMANPEQRDNQEDPATPTRNSDPLYSENELSPVDSVLENQEILSLIENWIDA
jgi:hypothetical protein